MKRTTIQVNERKKTEGGKKPGHNCPKGNHERQCQMVAKIMKKYNVQRLMDVSCVKNLEWIPVLVKEFSAENPDFRYYCTDSDYDKLKDTKPAFREVHVRDGAVEYLTTNWWKETDYPDNLDLLLSWNVLAHVSYGRVWGLFFSAQKKKVKLVIFDNYPAISNDLAMDRKLINVRRHPFNFPTAKEVIQEMAQPEDTEKRQFLVYEPSQLKLNKQK